MSVLTSGEVAPSTYTRLLLSETTWLKGIIQEYSTTFLPENSTNETTLLTDQQIEASLDSPRKPFFSVVLPMFARISKQRLLVTITEDENLSEHRPEALQGNKPSIRPELLSQAELSFERTVRASHEAWGNSEKEWFNHFNKAVASLEVLEEQRVLSLKKPLKVSQLRHALAKLNITLPKNLQGDISCADYLRLRVYLVCCNPKTKEISPDCDSYLEQLRPVLDEIANQEDALIKQFNTDIEGFLSKYKV